MSLALAKREQAHTDRAARALPSPGSTAEKGRRMIPQALTLAIATRPADAKRRKARKSRR